MMLPIVHEQTVADRREYAFGESDWISFSLTFPLGGFCET